jgi:hypothetical protein
MRIGTLRCLQIRTCAALVTIDRRLRGTAWLADWNGAGDRLCTEVRTLHLDVCIAAAIFASQTDAKDIRKQLSELLQSFCARKRQ